MANITAAGITQWCSWWMVLPSSLWPHLLGTQKPPDNGKPAYKPA